MKETAVPPLFQVVQCVPVYAPVYPMGMGSSCCVPCGYYECLDDIPDYDYIGPNM
jgi:hypothetical protein